MAKNRWNDYGVIGDLFLTPDKDVLKLKNLTDTKALFVGIDGNVVVGPLAFLEQCHRVDEWTAHVYIEKKRVSLLCQETVNADKRMNACMTKNPRKPVNPDDPFDSKYYPHTPEQEAAKAKLLAVHEAITESINNHYSKFSLPH